MSIQTSYTSTSTAFCPWSPSSPPTPTSSVYSPHPTFVTTELRSPLVTLCMTRTVSPLSSSPVPVLTTPLTRSPSSSPRGGNTPPICASRSRQTLSTAHLPALAICCPPCYSPGLPACLTTLSPRAVTQWLPSLLSSNEQWLTHTQMTYAKSQSSV